MNKLKKDVSTFSQGKLESSTESLFKRVSEISVILLDIIINYINAFNNQWVNVARFGPNGRFKINQKIARPDKNKNFQIPDDQYRKMSVFERFSKSLNFNDYKQNVYNHGLTNLTKKKKKNFIKRDLLFKRRELLNWLLS